MDNNNNEISIADIITLMLKKIWLIILMFIIGGGAAFFVSRYVMPEKFESYTTMYVKNSNTILPDNSVNASDLNTAKSLVSTYIAILKSDTMMRDIGEILINDFGEDRISRVFKVSRGTVSTTSLKSCFTMNAVDNTEVMKISAITTDAEVSMAVCEIIARLAPDFLIRVVGAGSVETIDTAQLNYNAVSPNITKNTAVGALAGAFLAMAIIFLIDFFDNTVKSSKMLSEKFEKSILGEISDIEDDIAKKNKGKNKKKNKKDGEVIDEHYLITDEGIPFHVTEAFKALRTNLSFSLSTSEKKIFAVSSSMPGEGKSTLASNTALALSQLENTKVLLIDADMRKPVQHKIFKIKNKKGLSSALGKMNKVSECIQSVSDNLDIIPSGPQPPNPSELLSSQQMEAVLTELNEKYDYIIVDMPPVNVVSDPLSIGKLIAGLVVVVKYASTTFDDVAEVLKKAELSDTKMLGFVMSRVKISETGRTYYRKKYKYSYKYGYKYGYGYYGGYYGYGGYGSTPKENTEDTDEASEKDD